MQRLLTLSLCLLMLNACGDIGNYDLKPVLKIVNESTCLFQKKLVNVEDLDDVVKNYKNSIPTDQQKDIELFLTIPKDAKMGTVHDVKVILRKNDLLNITVNTEE